jgi:hypothetical protein
MAASETLPDSSRESVMPSRREFLQTSATLSAVALNAALARAAAAVGHDARAAVGRVIYDDRYAEGRAFAALAAAKGIAALALDAGDITPLYDDLAELLRGERGLVAGLTQYGPMLVVEQLAAERRLHVEWTALESAARTSADDAAPFIHYYTPLAIQQGHAVPVDGPLYSWVVVPRAGASRHGDGG